MDTSLQTLIYASGVYQYFDEAKKKYYTKINYKDLLTDVIASSE